MQKTKNLLVCVLAAILFALGAIMATAAFAAAEEPAKETVSVLSGVSAQEAPMLTNGAFDTLSISTTEHLEGSGASVRYNLDAAGPNVGRGIHVFPNADLSGYNSLQITLKTTKVIELSHFGFQIFCGGKDATPGVEILGVNSDGKFPTNEWSTIAIDVSAHQSKMSNVGRLIWDCNVTEGKEEATTIYIDSIKAVNTESKVERTLLDATSVFGVGLTNAGNDAVAVADDGSLKYDISATGPNEGRGIHFFPRQTLQGVSAIEMTVKTTEAISYGVFGFQIFYGGVDGGWQHTGEGELTGIEPVWTNDRPTTEYTTISFDISAIANKLDNVGRIIFTCNLVAGQEKATTLYIKDISLVKGADYKGSDGIDPDAGSDIPSNTEIAPVVLIDGKSDLSGVNGSEAPAGGGYMLVHPATEKISVVTDVVYGDSESSVKYEMPATESDVGRGFHVMLGGKDLRGYDRIEIIAKAEKNMVYGFYGVQIVYEGGNGPLPLNAELSPTTEWQTITVDIKQVSKLFGSVERIILTNNVTAENTESNVIYYDSIRVICDEYFNKTVYDGSESVNTDLAVDSVELTEEYVKTGDSALKFNISKDATVGHNIVIPVNYDCSRFNQVDITLYLSDWTEFDYLGWQLHHSPQAAQGGLTFQNIEGINKGWATITYDLTDYKNYLNLINLFLTANFKAGAEKDMFIVVDNVTFRVVDEPKTEYISLADKVAPKINYIKFFNLENEVKIGDEIDLSGITVSDNEDNAPTMTITVTKDGNAVELTDKKFTVKEGGTYVATLVALDATGNRAEVELRFTAPAAAKKGKGCKSSADSTSVIIAAACILFAFAALNFCKKYKRG